MKAYCFVYGCSHCMNDDAVVFDEHLMSMLDVDWQGSVSSDVDLVEMRLLMWNW